VGVENGSCSEWANCGRFMRSARQVILTKIDTAVMKATKVNRAAESSKMRRRNMMKKI
jgi:hypothetical protein